MYLAQFPDETMFMQLYCLLIPIQNIFNLFHYLNPIRQR